MEKVKNIIEEALVAGSSYTHLRYGLRVKLLKREEAKLYINKLGLHGISKKFARKILFNKWKKN